MKRTGCAPVPALVPKRMLAVADGDGGAIAPTSCKSTTYVHSAGFSHKQTNQLLFNSENTSSVKHSNIVSSIN